MIFPVFTGTQMFFFSECVIQQSVILKKLSAEFVSLKRHIWGIQVHFHGGITGKV